ncbi:saccharopine dehydrogenase [Euhalothece natronophila Z-M001]|uniref:Saccharopine dehydrogenase n=1 Tax=Euhalothece natronophila Z-M001 TaxID=522448 RepID=A0A5B8NLG6_9CHRO|nr:saccharopine dehydrogenase NADP-binding domain-containing protein [Euhalothece natronophila]QDZ39767.1 saccharopine dehydrogenase [Euhalothece natronophila Z-M001]
MSQNVLVIGGTGNIGQCIAKDIVQCTDAKVTVTGRNSSYKGNFPFLPLNLTQKETITDLIADYDLVVHSAGPFHDRDGRVLKSCIEAGVNYVDVSDHRSFHFQVTPYHEQAQASGITAILHTGVFPGISNLMAKQGVESLDRAQSLFLYYLVGGSGGAGLTVMRTTFLGLKSPFSAWIDGKWQQVSPYSDRETVTFPNYGKGGVYWFDVAETYTLADTFPVETVVTKFGSIPDFYNHLTWLTAHQFPKSMLENPISLEFLSKVSFAMARLTDTWSGVGIAVCVEVKGEKDGKAENLSLQLYHDHTAIAAGRGAGSIAQLLLNQEIDQPGVWSVEQAVPISLFQKTMEQRGITINLQQRG